jgi:hypothetical protein
VPGGLLVRDVEMLAAQLRLINHTARHRLRQSLMITCVTIHACKALQKKKKKKKPLKTSRLLLGPVV